MANYLKNRLVKNCVEALYVILSNKNLENRISRHEDMPSLSKRSSKMAKINRTVVINGKQRWIHAQNEQEYAEKLAKLYNCKAKTSVGHNFKEYATRWFDVYSKPNVETVTAVTYKRQLDLYLIPAFGDLDVEQISVDKIQEMFNGMTGAKTSKQKAKTVLNMIFEAAIDDELIQKNPLKSKRLRITGSESTTTEVYSIRQMQYLVRHISDVKKREDQIYLALQALHPLRLEEVLGLKWEDVDLENMTIHIRRAVTHPTRNKPEVKVPKTEASIRTIGLSGIAASFLIPGSLNDYILGGEEPYSYQRVRRMCERIQRDTGFEERITPIRFRTTVLTDIYNQTKDVTIAQAAAGHTTAAMTLKHYVKGREHVGRMADVIDSTYTT